MCNDFDWEDTAMLLGMAEEIADEEKELFDIESDFNKGINELLAEDDED